jgi:tetratricopeptide (TPR) repeat protein
MNARENRGTVIAGWIVRLAPVCLAGLLIESALAQNESVKLPSPVQEAMTRGLTAANQKAWDVAIKYFEEARKVVPWSPDVLFNLALASDKAKNREAIAFYWYSAFLAAEPQGKRADQVRKRMTELDVAVEVNARKLLKLALSLLPASEKYCESEKIEKLRTIADSYNRQDMFYPGDLDLRQVCAQKRLAEAFADWGDSAGAVQALKGLPERYTENSLMAVRYVTRKLAGQGKFDEALAIADQSAVWIGKGRTARLRSDVMEEMVTFHLNAGNLVGARQTATRLLQEGMEEESGYARLKIAKACLKKGDRTAALEELSGIRIHNSARISFDDGFNTVAIAYLRAGDPARAMKALETLLEAKRKPQDVKKETERERLARLHSSFADIWQPCKRDYGALRLFSEAGDQVQWIWDQWPDVVLDFEARCKELAQLKSSPFEAVLRLSCDAADLRRVLDSVRLIQATWEECRQEFDAESTKP